jgi:hypothetical protein
MRIHEILSERERPARMSADTVRAITNSPAFRKWFGNSKVVASDGTPMVVYHGTASAFEAFEVAHIGKVFGDDKHGFFFTNNTGDDMASGYAERASQTYKDGKWEFEGGNVIPVFVKIEKPFTFASYAWSMGYDVNDDTDLTDEIVENILDGRSLVQWFDMHKRQVIHDALTDGHDGIILVDPGSVVAENLVVAFRPDQIKSVFNKGTWNPEDDRISESDVVDLGAHRNEKFTDKIKSVVRHVASGAWNAQQTQKALKYHSDGRLPLPLGTRMIPPTGKGRPDGVWEIAAYVVDAQNPDKYGYKVVDSSGDDEAYLPVSDPKTGVRAKSAVNILGWKAALGPNGAEKLNYKVPDWKYNEPPKRDSNPDIDAEFAALFGYKDA